jgi:hypothetical protein
VLFAPALRPELLALDEATEGLRAVLRRHADAVRLSETGSALALVNLNRPEDYAAAWREYGAGAGAGAQPGAGGAERDSPDSAPGGGQLHTS